MGEHTRTRTKIETELPQKLREQLNRLLLEGATYEECSNWCKEQGFDISKSSVGRYGKSFFEYHKQFLQFEDKVRSLKSEVGEGLTLDEMLSKILLKTAIERVMAGEAEFDEIMTLMEKTGRFQYSNIAREKFKADIEDRILAAADNVEKIAQNGGVSSEVIQTIRTEILGINT